MEDLHLHTQVQNQMEKAFWDLIKQDLKNEPQSFTHLIILITEIKTRLQQLTPNNRKLQTEIEEALDPDFLRTLFENKALDPNHFFNLINFLLFKLKQYCSPERDSMLKIFTNETLNKLQSSTIVYSEFIPWFFKEVYKHITYIESDISDFLKQLP